MDHCAAAAVVLRQQFGIQHLTKGRDTQGCPVLRASETNTSDLTEMKSKILYVQLLAGQLALGCLLFCLCLFSVIY